MQTNKESAIDSMTYKENNRIFDLITQLLGGASSQENVTYAGCVSKNACAAAVVLAGGSGERFGEAGGKQLIEIAGKPLLSWSIGSLDMVADVGLIVVVCPKDRRDEYAQVAIEPYQFVTPIVMADAGDSRQESAFSGLECVPDTYEFSIIHDGARPLITPQLITHVLNTIKGNVDADGVIVATPAIDTLKMVENGVVVGTPDRRAFWNAQTPQVFRTGMYRRAHASALYDGFSGTDDSSLIERLGGRVMVVEGKRDNIKLTMPEDYLLLASAIAAFRDELIGNGGEHKGNDGGDDAQRGHAGNNDRNNKKKV